MKNIPVKNESLQSDKKNIEFINKNKSGGKINNFGSKNLHNRGSFLFFTALPWILALLGLILTISVTTTLRKKIEQESTQNTEKYFQLDKKEPIAQPLEISEQENKKITTNAPLAASNNSLMTKASPGVKKWLDEYLALVAFALCLGLTVFLTLFGMFIRRTWVATDEEKTILNFEIKRLAAVATMTTDGVLITDAGKKITWANEGMTRISGYSLKEVVGNDLASFLQCAATDKKEFLEMHSALGKNSRFTGELVNESKSKKPYRFRIQIHPLFTDIGESEGFVVIIQNITDEHESRQSLIKERLRLSNIIEGTNAGTWEWNVQTDEIRLNERWSEISGFTHKETQNMRMRDWKTRTHPEDIIRSETELKNHFKGQTDHYECEIRMRKKNDSWIWIMAHGRLMTRTPDGKPEWITGTHQDITQRKTSEEKMVSNDALFRGAIDAISEAFAIYNADDVLIFFNEKYSQTYGNSLSLIRNGLTFETIVRGSVSNRHYPEAIGQEEAWIANRLVTHRMESFEGIQKLSDGRVIRTVDKRLPDGHTVCFRVDITELFRSREAAQISQEMSEKALNRLKVIYDILPVGLTIVDKSGKITDCNSTSESIMGVSKQDIFFHQSAQTNTREWEMFDEQGTLIEPDDYITARVLKSNVPIYDEISEVVFKDRRIWLSISAMPVEEETMGAVVAYVDITEQRSQRKAIIDAKLFAEQASQSKSQFLSNMSHEIRTPMNAILGMLSLLKKTDLSPRQAEYANKTHGAARSLLGLLNDILDFSKVEAGKMTLENQAFELDGVLQNLSVILSTNASSKKIELVYEIDPNLPKYLVGDSLRIEQVLINLGGNAVKFTKQGEIVISVKCLKFSQDTVTVEFSIRDQGIGIALANQDKIFEVFTQAEASTTRRYGGTGLGVAICQKLISLMGGQLKLESQLGQGSRFFFEIDFPVARMPPQVTNYSEITNIPSLNRNFPIKSDNPHSQYSHGSGVDQFDNIQSSAIRTLIIDDSPTARRSFEISIKSLGWTSQSVDSGEKAIELVKKNPGMFDLVLVDWTMPGLNGWQTCRALKEKDSGIGSAKLFMVTAQGRDMLATRSKEDQDMLEGFVVKPVTMKMLSEAWHSALLDADIKLNGRAPLKVQEFLTGRRLEGFSILVAEDNQLNQQVVRELLEYEGAKIEIVSNGLAAVVALTDSATSYDVVLMDLQMPVMDGMTATQRIRNELKQTLLPIIAMTANAMAHDRKACLDCGMNEHVGKPFDINDLVATILRVTGKLKSSASAQSQFEKPSAPKFPEFSESDLQKAQQCGVDLPGAINRMGGSLTTYSRLMKNFLDDLPMIKAQMQDSMSLAKYDSLARYAHTIKGLYATLGVTQLASLCGTSENVFTQAIAHESQLQLRSLIASISQSEFLLRTFSDALIEKSELALSGKPQQADLKEILECLTNLLKLLKDFDMESVNVIEKMRGFSWGQYKGDIQLIDNDVVALDFESAGLKCEDFIKKNDKK